MCPCPTCLNDHSQQWYWLQPLFAVRVLSLIFSPLLNNQTVTLANCDYGTCLQLLWRTVPLAVLVLAETLRNTQSSGLQVSLG